MTNELDASAINVVLASPGEPSDSGFLAARDLANVASEIGVGYRLIGGISVGLLTCVHGVNHVVPGRETADADFGATAEVIGDARLPVALAERGYLRIQGNRFVRKYFRPDGWGLELVVDLLAPSWTGRLTNNRNIGQLSVDEVPGFVVGTGKTADGCQCGDSPDRRRVDVHDPGPSRCGLRAVSQGLCLSRPPRSS